MATHTRQHSQLHFLNMKGLPPEIKLQYGSNYDFRVRLMDLTGGGPPVTAAPLQVETSSLTAASCNFRRWIRPLYPIWLSTAIMRSNEPIDRHYVRTSAASVPGSGLHCISGRRQRTCQ